ncbi:MAG: pentapeptide repeat-containing protein [Leptolyngbyaceae cyanobacterium HOT.MB2.61]|jgi:uncharacterized protein YjbI with pentapeptide repeats|nr:pentapeptide repeat-containing protein [Leptolyngbyaceae cyanobacterium HOT.MB2.61]
MPDTNLSSADLTNADLTQAKLDDGTRLGINSVPETNATLVD